MMNSYTYCIDYAGNKNYYLTVDFNCVTELFTCRFFDESLTEYYNTTGDLFKFEQAMKSHMKPYKLTVYSI